MKCFILCALLAVASGQGGYGVSRRAVRDFRGENALATGYTQTSNYGPDETLPSMLWSRRDAEDYGMEYDQKYAQVGYPVTSSYNRRAAAGLQTQGSVPTSNNAQVGLPPVPYPWNRLFSPTLDSVPTSNNAEVGFWPWPFPFPWRDVDSQTVGSVPTTNNDQVGWLWSFDYPRKDLLSQTVGSVPTTNNDQVGLPPIPFPWNRLYSQTLGSVPTSNNAEVGFWPWPFPFPWRDVDSQTQGSVSTLNNAQVGSTFPYPNPFPWPNASGCDKTPVYNQVSGPVKRPKVVY